MFKFLKKKEVFQMPYSEKEVLCNLIENYIVIANKNNTTLDDYISIIAFTKLLQIQYKEYAKNFQIYINRFEKQGILDEYQTYFKNIPKQIFIKNNFQKNVGLASEMLYGWFDGCTSRFIHFLIIFGLCGRPNTLKQKEIMFNLFEANSTSFSKQMIYYGTLYLNSKKSKHEQFNRLEDKNYEYNTNYRICKNIAEAYIREKNYNKALEYFEKAIYYLKKPKHPTLNVKSILEKINFRINYTKTKQKYPYIRREIIEMFNIDVKTFNNLTKDIKDNLEYKKDSNYSQKIINYLKEKVN